jgi:hypothetical protein
MSEGPKWRWLIPGVLIAGFAVNSHSILGNGYRADRHHHSLDKHPFLKLVPFAPKRRW